MNMSIRPRYLILAAVAAGGLYALGVSVGTLIFIFALAYMASMHLGHGGGAGGHSGGCGGHGQSKTAPDNSETASQQKPAASKGHVGHR